MKRRGFTLVELLVVIAIIAILAAILFPVINTAKKTAKMRADQTNMATLYQALKLYREDQGGYPALLLQVAEYDTDLARYRTVDELRRAFLFRSRVKDINVFTGIIANAKKGDRVNAYWPNRDPRPLAQGENCGMRQIYGWELPGDPCAATATGTAAVAGADIVRYNQIGIFPGGLNPDLPTDPVQFYAWDSYDIAPSLYKGPANEKLWELRYTLFWSLAAQTGGSFNDNPRQLGYHEPPESAVVTWNTFFQDTAGSPLVPRHTKNAMVLYLNGSVKYEDSKDLWDRSWRIGQ
jgi:prepilin-type N-terminal cleavage/methylation domain-containing protein